MRSIHSTIVVSIKDPTEVVEQPNVVIAPLICTVLPPDSSASTVRSHNRRCLKVLKALSQGIADIGGLPLPSTELRRLRHCHDSGHASVPLCLIL
jgi:hypothetical protein